MARQVLTPKTVISFRPRSEFEEDFFRFDEWCRKNDSSFGTVINSFVPAIVYALYNNMYEDPETGDKFVQADFGDVKLLKCGPYIRR